jgi:8-oxo-dGTP diphosphatase
MTATQLPEAVVVVVVRDRRVLVIERGPLVPRPGYWAPLSGGIEPGESQSEAVVRETAEEVGLRVTPVAKVWECLTDDGGYLLHWWLARASDGELSLNQAEVSDARWVDPAEFDRLVPTFADDRRFFAEIFPGLPR